MKQDHIRYVNYVRETNGWYSLEEKSTPQVYTAAQVEMLKCGDSRSLSADKWIFPPDVLQPAEYNPDTGTVTVTDESADFFGTSLEESSSLCDTIQRFSII